MIMDYRDRLYDEIKRQGLSILSLSKLAGIKPSTAQSWFYEKKRSEPTATNLFKVAQVLGVSVDYLMTGEELSLPDDDFTKPEHYEYRHAKDILSIDNARLYDPKGNSIHVDKEEPTILVPVTPQKLSAGAGEDFLPPNEYIGHVRILERMARGLAPSSLIAAVVKGDSMTGVHLFAGDVVVFAKDYVDENGLYAVSLRNEVLVKRLEFNPITNSVRIISENKNYAPIEVSQSDDNFAVLGKVVGWVHCHPH